MRRKMIVLAASLSWIAGGALAAPSPPPMMHGLIEIAQTGHAKHNGKRHHKGGKKTKAGSSQSPMPRK